MRRVPIATIALVAAASIMPMLCDAVDSSVVLRSGCVNVVVVKESAPTVRFAASEMTNYLSRVLGEAVPEIGRAHV